MFCSCCDSYRLCICGVLGRGTFCGAIISKSNGSVSVIKFALVNLGSMSVQSVCSEARREFGCLLTLCSNFLSFFRKGLLPLLLLLFLLKENCTSKELCWFTAADAELGELTQWAHQKSISRFGCRFFFFLFFFSLPAANSASSWALLSLFHN